MKKVLLTGGSGFIGRHTIPYLIENEFDIHILYNKKILREFHDVAEWHQCNLFNYDQQKKILEKIKPTHLLHFAWEANPKIYKTSKENFIWVESTQNLLENFHKSGGKRAVLAGTCAEYDWRFEELSEFTTPLEPNTIYGECKNNMRIITEKIQNQKKLSIAWGRIFFLYGPNEHKDRLVSSVINSLLNDDYALCTHGHQIRDFMYVKDIANAFVNLLDSNIESSVNIASGKPIKLRNIINTIGEIIGKTHLIKYDAIDAEISDPSILTADTTRLHNELQWHPDYELIEGLEETINWWREENIKRSNH